MNAKVLAALKRLQWSEVIDRNRNLARCPVCQRLENEGFHSSDCYIGEALASVKQGEPIRFWASDNGNAATPIVARGKAIIGAVASSTLPPTSMVCSRQVYLEFNGRRAHVWTHDKDRSTTFTESGRKLIEILESLDFSEVVAEQQAEFYRYIGQQQSDIRYFSLEGGKVFCYGPDLQAKETTLTPGDLRLCQAEGKMERIERPAELSQAA